jgi:hypothetical protein
MTALLAQTLPDNSGYVWAAYLILFALVLVYFAIMASKLSRLERDLIELDELADRRAEQAPSQPAAEATIAREVQESSL